MDEKSQVVISQYDIEVDGYYRERGGTYLETSQGFLLLRGRAAKEGRVTWEEEVKAKIVENGYVEIDTAVKNREEHFVTEGDYSETFLLRNWRQGFEINLQMPDDCKVAAVCLARLHKAMRGAPAREEYINEPSTVVFEKHLREMRRLSTYLRKRKQKSSFERGLEELLPIYRQKANEALNLLNCEAYGDHYKEAVIEGTICHGNYGSHSIVMLPNEQVFISNFEHAGIGPQIPDLYYLLRKSLEKNEWDFDLFTELLSIYEEERPLSKAEQILLTSLFLFPEKFYRVCNQYFNTRKAWIPAKNAQKLSLVLEQQSRKDAFDAKICCFF